MAKNNVSKQEKVVPTTTNKRIQPVEEQPTANKRLQVAKNPPTADKSLKTLTAESSDDDEEMATEEEEEEDSDSSSDENEQVKTPPSKNTSTRPCAVVVDTKEKQSSDSEAESETESESDSESMTNEKEKEVCVSEAQPTKKTKQPSEVVGSADVVKTEEKKEYFQRKWSQDDEIVLLQGMVGYKNDTGLSPPYVDDFYEIVKNNISFEVQRRQFTSKISTLKKKYYKGKGNKGVDENSFSNAHDKKCYKLSKLIWESIKVEEPLRPNDEPSERDWFFNSFLLVSFTRFGVHEDVVKQRWNKVPMMTKKRLEEKLKLVEAKEFECVLQKTDLLREVTSAIAEAN